MVQNSNKHLNKHQVWACWKYTLNTINVCWCIYIHWNKVELKAVLFNKSYQANIPQKFVGVSSKLC